MRFEGSTTKYPDVVILEENGNINHLIDLKTDTGWNRNGFYDFCLEWEQRIKSIKKTKTKFKNGTTKETITGFFTGKLIYHIVVLSKKNS